MTNANYLRNYLFKLLVIYYCIKKTLSNQEKILIQGIKGSLNLNELFDHLIYHKVYRMPEELY